MDVAMVASRLIFPHLLRGRKASRVHNIADQSRAARLSGGRTKSVGAEKAAGDYLTCAGFIFIQCSYRHYPSAVCQEMMEKRNKKRIRLGGKRRHVFFQTVSIH